MTQVSGAAALQQLQPLRDPKTPAVQFWGAKEAQRQKDEADLPKKQAAAKQKKLDDWSKKYGLNPKDFKNKYTGFKKYDDIVSDYGRYARDRYAKLAREAKYGNDEQRASAEVQLANMKDDFTYVGKVTDLIGKKLVDLKKATDEGKVSGASEEFEGILEKLVAENGGAFRYTPEGNFIVTGVKEDGEPFEIPVTDILDNTFTWIEDRNMLKDGNDILKQLGTDITKTPTRELSVETKLWNDNRQGKESRELIRNNIYGSDDIMADYLFKITNRDGNPVKKRKDFTDKEYKMVEDEMYKVVKNGYDEYYKATKLPQDRVNFGFGRNKQGNLMLNPVLNEKTRQLETQNFKVEGMTDLQEGLGFKLGDNIVNKTKELFEDEPNTTLTTIIRGEDGTLYGRVVDRSKKDSKGDSMSQTSYKGETTGTDKKSKGITYRRLDKTQLTNLSNLLGGETSDELEDLIVDIMKGYDMPVVETRQQSIGGQRQFSKPETQTYDTPFPEEARAVTRTVDGQTSLIEDQQPPVTGGASRFN